MGVHEAKCTYMPVKCKWCKEEVQNEDLHLANDCLLVPEFCGNGCGEKISRKDMEKHMTTMCTHQLKDCEYKEEGCQFMGYAKDLAKHNKEQCAYHTLLLKKSVVKAEQSLDDNTRALTQQNSDLKSEISMKLQPVINAVVKAESTIQHLQACFSEMALIVQTLQATNYNGMFIWKIPEIRRRRHEAMIGKTASLFSPPFYTSRYGYKVCLRLYLDGDGRGKGTHLTFYVCIMRGEYDPILQWPFKQKVTLMLLDQNKWSNIVQSFEPDQNSASFYRPHHEMNVASGFPMFAPLTVLDNASYVKHDTMFLKCKIKTSKCLKISLDLDTY